jgi:ferredoxin
VIQEKYSRGGIAMKVAVDQVKCGTMGVCVKICPEVFRFQEGSKKAIAISDDVPSDLVEKCTRAVKACPNHAIIIRSWS